MYNYTSIQYMISNEFSFQLHLWNEFIHFDFAKFA